MPSIGLILIAMFSIQIGASVAKQVFPMAGPAGTTALRVFIAALILSLVGQLWKHRISRKNILVIAIYGICLGTMNLLFYFSLERIPLGIAVALEFIGPLTVALLASKRIWDILWIVLAGLGIYLILPISSSAADLDLTGILLALGAGVFWGLYIVFGQSAGKKGPSLHVSAIGMWFAAIVAIPVGIYMNGSQLQNPSLLPMGIVIAILSSALPYALEMRAMRDMPAKTFGILMSMEPLIATLMGILFLHETLQASQWIAIFCIIIASVGSTVTSEKPKVIEPV